jgi:hypothetical protein
VLSYKCGRSLALPVRVAIVEALCSSVTSLLENITSPGLKHVVSESRPAHRDGKCVAGKYIRRPITGSAAPCGVIFIAMLGLASCELYEKRSLASRLSPITRSSLSLATSVPKVLVEPIHAEKYNLQRRGRKVCRLPTHTASPQRRLGTLWCQPRSLVHSTDQLMHQRTPTAHPQIASRISCHTARHLILPSSLRRLSAWNKAAPD